MSIAAAPSRSVIRQNSVLAWTTISQASRSSAERLCEAQGLGLEQFRFDCGNRCLGNFILQGKNVGQFAIITIGPNMIASRGVNELRCNANAISALADTAFQDVTHAELSSGTLHVYGFALVCERRIAGDHKEPTQL
jgi:hypothetical protein